MYKLFTSPICHECLKLKKILKEKEIEYKEYDITSVEGLAEYHYYGFRMSVPMLVKEDTNELPLDVTDKFS